MEEGMEDGGGGKGREEGREGREGREEEVRLPAPPRPKVMVWVGGWEGVGSWRVYDVVVVVVVGMVVGLFGFGRLVRWFEDEGLAHDRGVLLFEEGVCWCVCVCDVLGLVFELL